MAEITKKKLGPLVRGLLSVASSTNAMRPGEQVVFHSRVSHRTRANITLRTNNAEFCD